MKKTDIRKGGLYIQKNGRCACLVLLVERGEAVYLTFRMRDGKRTGAYQRSVDYLAAWAEREITPNDYEYNRLDVQAVEEALQKVRDQGN